MRAVPTPTQTGLKKSERKDNLKNAFKVVKDVKNLRVLLVDDLLLRAGLAQTHDEPVSFSVDFAVETDTDTRSVVLRCDRINSPPIELRFPIQPKTA